MGRPSGFSPEVRERAVRLVLAQQDAHDSQWAAIESIAGKIGCTAETLRKWVQQRERVDGKHAGLTTDERLRLRELEREHRELRRANEIHGRRWRFSPRRSSTADRNDGRVHRRRARSLRGRADLRAAADRPVDVLCAEGAGPRAGETLGTGTAGPCHLQLDDLNTHRHRLGGVAVGGSVPALHFTESEYVWR
jgi:transposase